MRIAIGSDEATELTAALIAELEKRGHTLIRLGALAPEVTDSDWPVMAAQTAERVAAGEADEGIVCCWTGTGACLAANKVPGIRAALVHDAETARGARIWNRANVLALSLRATSIPISREILDAWLNTPVDSGEAQSEWNTLQMRRLQELEAKYRRGNRDKRESL